eukprot:CAMPEP_0204372044 /NCGR_PEP_ID=MMETSP0469-20131031/46966_1 /ASSEMBLY_ACC=CAM_ASM_000384 /TAXON_ID=2969 /ORGANISM="Oxyrrhis marina" /LENGTH=67 /DNA_ID=CAMNT_0051362265 /DNA_START=260 /DNA_END=459 /DNA_ORIENTATION=-
MHAHPARSDERRQPNPKHLGQPQGQPRGSPAAYWRPLLTRRWPQAAAQPVADQHDPSPPQRRWKPCL